ncbi:MAG: CCC motif membrane protein [Vicingaceae bacterium]|nr:CCC motif membrane protein [Vicingaceae bacterium]
MEENQDTSTINQQPTNNQPHQSLPNSTGVLILGILSIVFFLCYICIGIIGLTLGIIALVLAKKDLKLYNLDPKKYTSSSLSNLKAGKICAIIGICLSSLWLIVGIIYIVFILIFAGGAFNEILNNPNLFP